MKNILKNLCKVAVLGSTVFLATSVYAANVGNGCALKEQQIQKQIDYAKKYNNSYRQRGLERALSNVKAYCTEDSLKKEVNDKIAEKQQKVNERQAELNEAKANGNAKKIAKKQKKLVSAQEELETAKKESTTYFN